MPRDGQERTPGELWSEGEAEVVTETDRKVQIPRLFKVLLHNDNYTTMEFVVMILMDVFHHPEARAVEIMLQVHQQGLGLAGVYPFDVAETKVRNVTDLARRAEYPLRCSLEPA